MAEALEQLAMTYLAHILGFGHLLANDGFFVASIVSRSPPEHCVGPPRDVALPSILDLQTASSAHALDEVMAAQDYFDAVKSSE